MAFKLFDYYHREREMREVKPLVWFFIDLNRTAVVDAAFISAFEKIA